MQEIHKDPVLPASRYRVTSPAPREAWKDLMMEDLDAIPYQSPEWCEAICADGRFRDISRHYEFEDGCRIVVPLVTVITLGPARFTAASYPDGCGMGGAICCGNTTARHLRHVLKDLMASNVFSIKIRPNPMQGRRWAEAASGLALTTRARRAHVIDLKEGFDHVYNKLFTRDTRSGIRKAERKGVVVRNSSNGDLIPVLHGLLARSVERWAAQQREPLWLARFRFRRRDPIEKLYRIQEAFGSDCKVWAAWVDGTPVAASLVLTGRHVNDSRGALDRAALGTSCANDLLQKLTIEEACQSGCRFYHLGESGNSASLAHFKERFGATAYHYDEILIEQFPLFRIEQSLKGGVKKVIGFKD